MEHTTATTISNCHSRDDQLLLYIRGEGGVGKSRVVMAIEIGFSLLSRKDQLVLAAPTGAAANNIGGSTIHTCLGIGVRNKQGRSQKVSSLWTRRFALIIDEISMVELDMLSNIGKQLAKARGLGNDSTAVFGGLPIVILMGDFYQFSPVVGRPLWGQPRSDEDHNGKTLWECFDSVITLTQQMRQLHDPHFTSLLMRARAGALTQHDVTILNDKVVTKFTLQDPLQNIVIVQRNKTRHLINRLQAERFARRVGRDIIIFPAEHSHTKKDGGKSIIHRDVFQIQDGEHGATGPGLLYYCQGMPVSVLSNLCTPLGIVNGARATAYGVVTHPDGKSNFTLKTTLLTFKATYMRIDPLTLLCSRPARCILLQREKDLKIPFPTLPANVYPVFPERSTVALSAGSISRLQIPITLGFALTDYKVQGATFTSAVVDLKRQTKSSASGQHKRFCSTYVQLSRLRSFDGLGLLQPIDMSDINNQPDPALATEDVRLRELDAVTSAAWQKAFETRRNQH